MAGTTTQQTRRQNREQSHADQQSGAHQGAPAAGSEAEQGAGTNMEPQQRQQSRPNFTNVHKGAYCYLTAGDGRRHDHFVVVRSDSTDASGSWEVKLLTTNSDKEILVKVPTTALLVLNKAKGSGKDWSAQPELNESELDVARRLNGEAPPLQKEMIFDVPGYPGVKALIFTRTDMPDCKRFPLGVKYFSESGSPIVPPPTFDFTPKIVETALNGTRIEKGHSLREHGFLLEHVPTTK